jgi:selenophosphate synthetase-related protein
LSGAASAAVGTFAARAFNSFPAVADRNAKAIKVRVRQPTQDFNVDIVFGKTLHTYSDMPSFSSHSVICCIAAIPPVVRG